MAHDLALAGHRADRHPASERFAQHAQVRDDTQVLLRAAGGQAKGGQHFVEEQYHAVPVAQLAAPLQQTGLGQDATLVIVDRFQHQRGHSIPVPGKRGFQCRFVVERDDDDVAASAGGDPRRFRIGDRRSGRPRLVQRWRGAEVQGVGIAVKVPFELDDLVAAGNAAGQAQGMHHGLGPRAGKPHQFRARYQLGDSPSQRHVMFRLVRTEDAQIQGPRYRRLDPGMVVAQQRRAVRDAHVDVFAAFDVVDSRAVAAGHVQRMADGCIGTRGGRDAARQITLSLVVQLVDGRQDATPSGGKMRI